MTWVINFLIIFVLIASLTEFMTPEFRSRQYSPLYHFNYGLVVVITLVLLIYFNFVM